jgi:hypothetical protein
MQYSIMLDLTRYVFNLAVALMFMLLSLLSADSATRPDLSGMWYLNQEQSDAPGVKVRGLDTGRSSEGKKVRLLQAALRSLAEPPHTLDITQDETEITINEGTERIVRTRTLYIGDQKLRRASMDGEPASYRAWWENSRLLVETVFAGSGRLVEVYERAPDGHRLYVTVRVEDASRREPIEIRRVYDLVISI